AERRAEPGDAGVRVRSVRRVGDHHVDVGSRASHPFVEEIARAADPAALGGGCRLRRTQKLHGLVVTDRGGGVSVAAADDGEELRARLAGAEIDVEMNFLTGDN